MHELASRVLAKEPRALARALRKVDDRASDHVAILKDLYPHTGRAFVVGITGNPGAGKSTLTDRLIAAFRARGETVAVLAVDPTSPYTGGAILGDRIRMQRHAEDPGVFIRSVATRGALGGLSRSARDMIRVMDAFGADVVLVETVGVGQDELEITRTAETTLVVMAPGMGDEIQAIKAGILETADVFAVNKADRDGADSTVRDLELMIALGKDTLLASSKVRGHLVHSKSHPLGEGAGNEAGWTPPILKVVALKDTGTAELVLALLRHKEWIRTTPNGQARRTARIAEEFREMLREGLIEAATRDLEGALSEAVRRIAARELDPYAATEDLVFRFQHDSSMLRDR